MSIPRYSVTVHLTKPIEVSADLALSADDNDETSSIVHDGSLYSHPSDRNPDIIYIDVSARSEKEAERLALEYLKTLYRCSCCDLMATDKRFMPFDSSFNEFVAICPECFYVMGKRGFSTVLELLDS